MKIFRQGDVLIKQIDQIPQGLKRKEDKVLVYGEVTGHAHRLVDGSIYENNTSMYLELLQPSQIIHEEHYPIDLPAGNYQVIRQREYTNKDAVRLVID